ncbi:hypothetical protein [Photobacterium phosphoreum]|uniref:hypothetical protein n=1 Tax=Photobacterium phosphoreum TaxID=659 RepID=UPI001E2CB56F|nr:hypothetical protein [Photobacterium phosphoreum]MCD9480489.1 zinc chelation protein SecC [Photobacterium phosphoreum]
MMKISLSTLEDVNDPELQTYLDELKKRKEQAQVCNNEEVANAYWREIEAIELNITFIKCFGHLKAKQYRTAWNLLERCEINCKFLIENSTTEFQKKKRVSFIQEFIVKFQSLFPYCVFVSPGFKVGFYTCGICGHKVRPRSRCKHKKGKVYNGQLCLHEGHELEPIEISIVDKPVQKYSVMHDDSTLDFSLLDYLMEVLNCAFEYWDYVKTKMSFPRERFATFTSDDLCPCKSGSYFKDCCESKSEIEIPHIDFIFTKEIPDDKEKIKFPY